MSNRVTYTPGSGEPDVTMAYGLMFKAGQAVTVDDPAIYQKLKGNPVFSSDEKEAADPRAQTRKAVEKELDGRSKEARAARAKADEANMDAEAKERAAKHLAEMKEAADEGKAAGPQVKGDE